MIRPRFRHPLLTLAAAIAALLGTAGESHAGFCHLWNCLFGPHQHYAGYSPGFSTSFYIGPSYYGARYAPAYSPGCCAPVQTYRPVSYYSAPVCNPCGPCAAPCSPCGPAGCPTGGCAVGYAPTNGRPQPTPDRAGGAPRTYVEDEPRNGQQPQGTDEGWDKREQDPDGFGGDRSGTNGETRESFKKVPSIIDEDNKPVSPPANEAPAGEKADDTDGSKANEADSEGGTQTEQPELPRFNFDEKLTWQSTAKRSRLVIEARFTTPVVARRRVDPNTDWLPAAVDTRIVRK
ncbi:MAG: hypothetical protein KY476_06675 [Planctomycetes bacterium]|nr:hypothetical protein [Planctomycetota bacterium]